MMLDDAGFDRNDKVAGREPVQRKDKPSEQLYDCCTIGSMAR